MQQLFRILPSCLRLNPAPRVTHVILSYCYSSHLAPPNDKTMFFKVEHVFPASAKFHEMTDVHFPNFICYQTALLSFSTEFQPFKYLWVPVTWSSCLTPLYSNSLSVLSLLVLWVSAWCTSPLKTSLAPKLSQVSLHCALRYLSSPAMEYLSLRTAPRPLPSPSLTSKPLEGTDLSPAPRPAPITVKAVNKYLLDKYMNEFMALPQP